MNISDWIIPVSVLCIALVEILTKKKFLKNTLLIILGILICVCSIYNSWDNSHEISSINQKSDSIINKIVSENEINKIKRQKDSIIFAKIQTSLSNKNMALDSNYNIVTSTKGLVLIGTKIYDNGVAFQTIYGNNTTIPINTNIKK